jgi:hypothetical protein
MQNRSVHAQLLQQQGKWPHGTTVARWVRREQQLGHSRAFVPQGNKGAHVLGGHTSVMLAWYRAMYPKVTAHEINAFLFNASRLPPGQRRLYHPSQISRMEDRLGLSRKASSTAARQASHPRNLQKRWQYWNMNYPYGIADIERDEIIDLDEAAFFLETCNRDFGECFIGLLYRRGTVCALPKMVSENGCVRRTRWFTVGHVRADTRYDNCSVRRIHPADSRQYCSRD